MVDHPLHELHDMKNELHANAHTKRAIVICCAVGIVAIILFLGLVPLLRAPALPVDPVASGAASAFDVAEPPPPTRAGEAYEAGNPPEQDSVPAPVIPPADLGPATGNGGGSSAAPPVVYAPPAP